jgi:U3 small nucleolar RNA-associated protein 14
MISEQIRRGDDLQRKIMGDDESGDESDSGEELEDLMRDPNQWGEEVVEESSEVRKGVLGMKFMRDAEEARKRLNAEQLAELRTTLDAGSDDDEILAQVSSAQIIHSGRKTFTPGNQVT